MVIFSFNCCLFTFRTVFILGKEDDVKTSARGKDDLTASLQEKDDRTPASDIDAESRTFQDIIVVSMLLSLTYFEKSFVLN